MKIMTVIANYSTSKCPLTLIMQLLHAQTAATHNKLLQVHKECLFATISDKELELSDLEAKCSKNKKWLGTIPGVPNLSVHI